MDWNFSIPDPKDNSFNVLHSNLWFTDSELQASFWHSVEQYSATLHPEHAETFLPPDPFFRPHCISICPRQ